MKYNKDIFKTLALFIILLALSISCSTSKDKFVNRSYHNTTTIFNVLFNGNNSLERAEEIIVDNYQDDFREVLPVAPYEKGMKAMSARGHLQKADEKASKAVQKHSMNIGGNEKNNYIDQAYLLLGKSRFYQSKYLPSLEAFNYIKINFRGKASYYDALLWSARAQIELGNYAIAQGELNEYIKNKHFPKEYKATLYAFYGDALYRQNKFEAAARMMENAIKEENDKRIKTRYAYILAQIYELDGRKSSSSRTFDKVIKDGSPYKYVFHAKLGKAANFDPDVDELKTYVTYLEKMLEEKKNVDELEKVYYELGKVYYKDLYYEKSIENLNKSLAAAGNKKYEKGLAYELLGDVYFEEALYKNSAAYYDSTLTVMSKSYKNYKFISRKRKKLDDVIKYINIAEPNDSILEVVAMSEDERIVFFEAHIERLKEEERRRIEQEKLLAEQLLEDNSSVPIQGDKTNFYLYNPVTLQYGKSEFEKRWGDRPLQDQWRILSKPVNTLSARIDNEEDLAGTDSIVVDQESAFVNPLYKVAYYTDRIPTNSDTIAKLRTDRDFAFYALGLLYNEQFSKYELSGTTLEKLLGFEPDEAIKLPSYYYLYKDYKALGYESRTETYKNIILTDYPESRYAKLILEPDKINKLDKESVDLQFEELVRSFSNREFRASIPLADSIIEYFPNGEMIPKVELIKSRAIGKLGQDKEYEKALEFVMYSYPNNDASESAKSYLAELKKEKKLKYKYNDKDYTRLVILIDKEEDVSALEKRIEYPIWQKRLHSSRSEFDFEKDVFVVFGFQSWQAALDFKSEFMSNKQLIKDLGVKNTNIITISQYNFNILQRKKRIDSYREDEVK